MKFSAAFALLAALALAPFAVAGEARPERSTAGFYAVADSGREAANFNVGWRFLRGDAKGAESPDFNDKDWALVSAPHGVDGALPEEASGCANYRGPAWYRKRFTPPESLRGKRVSLHFEGVLGKSKIFVNGKLLKEHFSGFLPAVVDVTDALAYGKSNVVAVLADNSDDPSFPPGKPQQQLDYSYFGGIYRDVWFVSTNRIHITDPNEAGVVAGGGVFFRTEKLSGANALVGVKTHLANGTDKAGKFTVEIELRAPGGAVAARASSAVELAAGASGGTDARFTVANARLWSPDSPALHDLIVTVKDASGAVVDGLRERVGIRTVEVRPDAGLVLNGKPFAGKLIGANRHQDHAVIGFALSDNLHRADVQKLRDAGLRVIRSAHYPQDPAFMDACDELGMFVIVNTPGWQFWNNAPIFAERVYSDIRNMVRRDRNHASVLMWEPILNETHYPADFANNARDITHAEYPYPGCVTGADEHARGYEHFEVRFSHPPSRSEDGSVRLDPTKVYFTREWGDNVDDWSSHNSPSRVARAWGEVPQLVQAKHYAHPDYSYSCWETLCRAPANHFGGTLWHSFDHQRGYHPDPFFGGIMDAFRRPKYSYELFKAQRPAGLKLDFAESGPTVFVANGMTPFSPADVTVYSNCDAVRLSFNGKVVAEQKSAREPGGMPSPIFTFPKVFDFMAVKALHRAGKAGQVSLVAEGLIDGKVVTTHTVRPAKRAEKIRLFLDNCGMTPEADGSTVVTVVAAVTDRDGNTKRLNDGAVTFSVSGEGELIGDAPVGANPRAVKWGEAPALVRTTTKPGRIRVVASYAPAGAQMPQSGTLEFETAPAATPLLGDEIPRPGSGVSLESGDTEDAAALRLKLEAAEKELSRLRNREVERQQADFEGGAAR